MKFAQLYEELQTKRDPWMVVNAIQQFVTRALAWAFGDRLEPTGSFQHTFLPDFLVHLQPGPYLALHMRFSMEASFQLIDNLLTRGPDEYKHIILVNNFPIDPPAVLKKAKLNRRRDILVTSFELIDEIASVVDAVERLGAYRLGTRLTILRQQIRKWCLETAGWAYPPKLEHLVIDRPIHKPRAQRHQSFVVWSSGQQRSKRAVRFLVESTNLGAYRVRRRSFTCAITQKDELVRQATEIVKPTVMLSRERNGFYYPLLAVMFSRHAPMGQNAYQTLPQVVTCAEKRIPFVLVAPEAETVERSTGNYATIERIHPLLFQALARIMDIYRVPALLIPWPTEEDDEGKLRLRDDKLYPELPDRATSEIQLLLQIVNLALDHNSSDDVATWLLGYAGVMRRRLEMEKERFRLGTRAIEQPPKGSGLLIQTSALRHYIRDATGKTVRWHALSPLLERPSTLFMINNSKTFRAYPYLGTLLAFDFAFCRSGPRPDERSVNLMAHFREVPLAAALPKLFVDGRVGQPRHRMEALFLKYCDGIVFQDGILVRNRRGEWTVHGILR